MSGEYWILIIIGSAISGAGCYMWGFTQGTARAVLMVDAALKTLGEDRKQKRAHKAALAAGYDTDKLKH